MEMIVDAKTKEEAKKQVAELSPLSEIEKRDVYIRWLEIKNEQYTAALKVVKNHCSAFLDPHSNPSLRTLAKTIKEECLKGLE